MTEKDQPAKKRNVRKRTYLVEERRLEDQGPERWFCVPTSGKHVDSHAALKWVRQHGDKVAGKTLRIVRVCEEFKVKTQTRVLFD